MRGRGCSTSPFSFRIRGSLWALTWGGVTTTDSLRNLWVILTGRLEKRAAPPGGVLLPNWPAGGRGPHSWPCLASAPSELQAQAIGFLEDEIVDIFQLCLFIEVKYNHIISLYASNS